MKIIYVNGRARTGKNTLAEYIYDYECRKGNNCAFLHFSRPLKMALNAFYGVPLLPWNYWDDKRSDPQSTFRGLTFRQAIMDFAENIVKPKFGKDFYARCFEYNVTNMVVEDQNGNIYNANNLKDPIDTLIVPDLGYPEELPTVNGLSFTYDTKIMLLTRKEAEKELDNRHIFNRNNLLAYFTNSQFVKHRELPEIYTVTNDDTLDDLRYKINGILKECYASMEPVFKTDNLRKH